jgi:hypothetical protein
MSKSDPITVSAKLASARAEDIEFSRTKAMSHYESGDKWKLWPMTVNGMRLLRHTPIRCVEAKTPEDHYWYMVDWTKFQSKCGPGTTVCKTEHELRECVLARLRDLGTTDIFEVEE